MFHIAKRQEMIFFLILGGLPKKKAPVSHRCLFMEIFLFSGIQSTSESPEEIFDVRLLSSFRSNRAVFYMGNQRFHKKLLTWFLNQTSPLCVSRTDPPYILLLYIQE